jgi:predicted AAA+ superfamily ATPase
MQTYLNTICNNVAYGKPKSLVVCEPTILEAIVATHLARKYETFYWKNKSEVDVVVKLEKKQIGIEVKKVGRTWIKSRHLEKTLLLTKDEIPTFLASLEI